jgi:hypothetical protein
MGNKVKPVGGYVYGFVLYFLKKEKGKPNACYNVQIK